MSKNAVNKGTAKAALTQMLSAVNIRMETLDLKMKSEITDQKKVADESMAEIRVKKNLETEGNVTDEGMDEGHDVSVPFLSVAHKDSFLVFRALCKLSS